MGRELALLERVRNATRCMYCGDGDLVSRIDAELSAERAALQAGITKQLVDAARAQGKGDYDRMASKRLGLGA